MKNFSLIEKMLVLTAPLSIIVSCIQYSPLLIVIGLALTFIGWSNHEFSTKNIKRYNK